jgi:hypothetical protein
LYTCGHVSLGYIPANVIVENNGRSLSFYKFFKVALQGVPSVYSPPNISTYLWQHLIR